MKTHTFTASTNVVVAQADEKDLYIKFHHGGTYKYPNAAAHFEPLITAESAGKYVHAHLKQLGPIKVEEVAA